MISEFGTATVGLLTQFHHASQQAASLLFPAISTQYEKYATNTVYC